MRIYKSLVLLPLLLTGCTSTDMQSALNSLDGLGKSLNTSLNQPVALGGTGSNSKSLSNSPLHNVLRQTLSTDGSAPEWPKVVITDLQIPSDQLTLTRSLRLKANECIYFNAVLWHDAKHSDRFDNLSLCATELPKQSNNFVLTWKSFSISGKNTGQVRGDGPTPPYNKLPSDSEMDRWLMNQFGLYYVGSLLTLVGYDQNFTADDRRFWVKNLKK